MAVSAIILLQWLNGNQNFLIICGDMNDHRGKSEDKFRLHKSTNRNGKYLTVFSREK